MLYRMGLLYKKLKKFEETLPCNFIKIIDILQGIFPFFLGQPFQETVLNDC